jgi:hypothetical protein
LVSNVLCFVPEKHKEKGMSYQLKIDMNVLNHLGIGLYSSTPAVITEIIANAWDAAAENVTIDIGTDRIEVADDGMGMNADQLQNRFLNVGYARRDDPSAKDTTKPDRPVMGRKGIGKLAMFSLASRIEVQSKRAGCDPVAAVIDVGRLRESIKLGHGKVYELEDAADIYDWGDKTGTRLTLTQLNTGTYRTASYLRPRVARRFSIIGDIYEFNVVLDGEPITRADRNYQNSVQFLWYLDDKSKDIELAAAGNISRDALGEARVARLDGVLDVVDPRFKLRGFIATVEKPSQLRQGQGREDEVNMNQIALFANGRVFQEDMLKEVGSSRVFSSYLIGEIHADFLDADDTDRATANREAVKQNDPLVTRVGTWLRMNLNTIAEQWDEWRRELKPKIDDERIKAALERWYQTLETRDRKLAEKLVNPILQGEYANDENTDLGIKKDLIRSTIVGFEKLKIKKKLDLLENITDVTSTAFQRIFIDLNEVEATYYHDITRTRLAVIEKFGELRDAAVLEKVAQEYLFNHLWLLDPTWDRVSGSEQMELRLSEELKTIAPDDGTGARLDIAYRASSGRHIIIELKRPGKNSIRVFDLMDQGAKYRAAMTQYLKDHPDFGQLHGRVPPIDVFFVTEHLPIDPEGNAHEKLRQLSMQSFTYTGMVENAKRAYREYIDGSMSASIIDGIVEDIV